MFETNTILISMRCSSSSRANAATSQDSLNLFQKICMAGACAGFKFLFVDLAVRTGRISLRFFATNIAG